MYVFKNKDLKKNLNKKILKKKNIKLLKKNITDIDYNKGSVLIKKKSFCYDLIILSMGGNSKLYSKITEGRSIKKNYKEIALTTNFRHTSKIDSASQFFLNEGPLAILPFSKNYFSVVWSISNSFFNKNNKLLKFFIYKKVKILLNNIQIKNIDKLQFFPINLDLKTKYLNLQNILGFNPCLII